MVLATRQYANSARCRPAPGPTSPPARPPAQMLVNNATILARQALDEFATHVVLKIGGLSADRSLTQEREVFPPFLQLFLMALLLVLEPTAFGLLLQVPLI